MSISLVPAGAYTELLAGAGLRGMSTQVRADGIVRVRRCRARRYTVKASVGGGGGRGRAAPDAPVLWAAADVSVTGLDVDVPLTLQPGVAITGRVVFEGAQPSPAELQSLTFMLMPPGSGGQLLCERRRPRRRRRTIHVRGHRRPTRINS